MDVPEVFDHLSSKIGQLLFGRTEGDRNIISKTLDDLNSLNYHYPVVKNSTKAVLLVNQCCSFIPPDDSVLVPKCAQLVINLVTTQNIFIEGRTLLISVQWCCRGIQINCGQVVLKALEALLRNNVHNVHMLLPAIMKDLTHQISSIKCQKLSQDSQEILLLAIQCLEATTVFPSTFKPSDVAPFFPHIQQCAQVFISFLCVKDCTDKSPVQSKIVETCLLGLQNIIIIHPGYLQEELGLIIGIIKTYMLYNIKGIEYVFPEKMIPSTLSIPEIIPTVVKEKTGGKVTKQRKHRTGPNSKKKEKRNNDDKSMDSKGSDYVPATTSLDYSSDNTVGHSSGLNCRLKTSDSDFSDNEGGKLAKLSHCCNKVRQAALNLFQNVIKHTDKSTIFLYWSSFIPESPSSGKHNLVSCILKEPSTRGKMCALNVLLLLLTSSKMYLAQAESSDKTSSFTPFCVVLGLSLTELHKSLCLALNQVSAPVLTQVLKCLAALVQATPYHRMENGLITKMIRNVKPLIYHRDASVQVTALIVTGCILAFEPVIPEIKQIMIKMQKEPKMEAVKVEEHQPSSEEQVCDTFDYAQFSSDEDEDKSAVIEIDSVPWLLQKCLSNLGVTFDNAVIKESNDKLVPAPVKLESLQVLSAMTRNYFETLILPHLNYIVKALEASLVDKYVDLRLHAGRAVDFFGQAMARIVETKGSALCLNFWQTLLNGPLVSLLQSEQHATLRAIGCDCLGSIGPHIFQQLPRDKQILCVTLLFACTKDEENTVRGAAVRALALCVLYPSLREDSGFVVDTAESILETLKDENLTVRVKASWSLGNLSDALVLNSKSEEITEDQLPEKVLLKLFEASIKSAADNDKIKMNVVRAIGNLIQLVDGRLLVREEFRHACEQALNALIKGSTTGINMKVRWNACYALGNALKNPSLYNDLDANVWQPTVFNKLAELVVGFKNFKVRINAALALSSPSTREHYGIYFIPVWTALLKALENSENMDDFTEYKHRDHLIEQICLSCGHLTTLLAQEDLSPLESILNLYQDVFKTHMHKVLDRLVPEKCTELFSAACCLTALESTGDVNAASEKRVISCLKSVFVPHL